MQTRMFPRTLDQAFPKTAAYACALERQGSKGDRAVWWTCIVALVALAAIMIAERL